MSRTVLITGASSGIGLAVAEHLAAHGDRVFGTSRTPRETAPGEKIEWAVMDVCDDASVEAGVARGPSAWDGYAAQAVVEAAAASAAADGAAVGVDLPAKPALYQETTP